MDKRKKTKRKFEVNKIVKASDLKRTFSKGDTTNWSYKLMKTTEIVIDTIPSYKMDQLPERYENPY